MIHTIDAVDVSAAWTCFLVSITELHLEIAIDHHARKLRVIVANKVIVNVRVELVARLHWRGPALAIVHDRSASYGAASVHVGHVGHLRVHGDGRWG